jgi:penicillin-binding protein 1C
MPRQLLVEADPNTEISYMRSPSLKKAKQLVIRGFQIFAISAIIAFLIGWITVEFYIWTTPLPDSLAKELTVNGTPAILARDGTIIAESDTSTARVHIPATYPELGKWLPIVTVQLEDHRFYQHAGVDFYGLCAAFARNARSLKLVSGASTITQQLIKQADGRLAQSVSAKFREFALALKIEREEEWTKKKILTAYINRLEYGNRFVGPESASRAYFGKSCRDLTLKEAILLAGIPNAPTAFNPWLRKEASTAKYRRSVERLAVLEIITPEEAKQLTESPPRVQQILPARRVP